MKQETIIEQHNKVVFRRRKVEDALDAILNGESHSRRGIIPLANASVEDIAAVLDGQDTDTIAEIIKSLARKV